MTRLIRDALLTCQKTLWRLLVLHEKGEIDLKDHKQHVDFAEREATQALEELESEEDEA